ncbi:hypothetical protein ACIQC5_11520 [Paenarthrobacter sp. NPDC092416]
MDPIRSRGVIKVNDWQVFRDAKSGFSSSMDFVPWTPELME